MESSDALLNGLQPIPNNHTTAGAMRQPASEIASAVDQLLSPPSEVPADPEKPVILEQWKSDADQASAPLPAPLPADDRLGYAVVGLGHLALGEIIPALQNCTRSKLVALVSGSPEKLKKVAGQYGVKEHCCYSYDNFDDIRDNKEVDVVYIVLPNGLHKDFVIRSAQAGKHVLCEKPMANSSEECREMIAACQQAAVRLMVAYRIHFKPHNRKVRDMLQQKQFGQPKYLETHNSQSSANKDHWRHKKALAGGGASRYRPVLFKYGKIHTGHGTYGSVRLPVQHTGQPAFCGSRGAHQLADAFPGGIIASCATDYDVHESRRYRVNCQQGWIDLEQAYAYSGQRMTTSRAQGKARLVEEVMLFENNQFAEEMDHFSDCITNNKVPLTPGEEGLQDHLIMEAVYRSAAEGRPVRIEGLAASNNWKGPEPDIA